MQPAASRSVATAVVALGAVSVGALHAFQRDARPPPERPRAAASRAPDAPADPAEIPTVRQPCVDDRTELRIAASQTASQTGASEPVLCWGDRCLSNRDEPVAPPGAAAVISAPAAVVGPDQVCTGTRCDSLGPRLRAALAKLDPDRRVSATRDHAAIVVRHEFAFEAWNRALDRRIDVGAAPDPDWISGLHDTEPESIDVLGDLLLVSWSCHEYCSATAEIRDARGRAMPGPDLAIEPLSVRENRRGDSIVAVGDDRFLVLGLFGEVAMVAHGRVVAQDTLLRPDRPRDISLIQAQVVPGDAGPASSTVEVLWCAGRRCEVTNIAGQRDNPQRWSLRFDRDFTLPLCPR
jgi:hypothetical protein